MPLEAHIKEHPVWFKRFGALWTPTVLVMDPDGVERYRIEGYLPKDWFRARLEMATARIDASGYSLPETIAMDVACLIFAVSRTRCR